MNQHELRALAAQMTAQGEELRKRLSAVLEEMGFANFEITEFNVAPREDKAVAFSIGAAPCPTECIVTPSGAIRCFPKC